MLGAACISYAQVNIVEGVMMKTDSDIKRDVEAELRWSPDIDETDVAVKVNGGAVTLTGFVGSYLEKNQAESAVKRVGGVAGVANDIQVRLAPGIRTEDPEIVRAAIAAIKFELPLSADNLKVLVHQGHLTLEGCVEWNFQRERVENAVRRLRGVMALNNQITIKPLVKASEIKHLIEDAFRRSAEVDANRISVKADGGTVVLSGDVRTWTERIQAQRTAWSAPGVTQVKNEISVSG
jgi:osmotically-inducible protein OsmY